MTREAQHWREWAAELAGTTLLMIGGLSAVTMDFGAHSPVAPLLPSHSLRLLLTSALFAGSGPLVAISPLGRMSGAHLNPAVSLAFWLAGKMHDHDVAAYVLASAWAQCSVPPRCDWRGLILPALAMGFRSRRPTSRLPLRPRSKPA